MCGLRSRTLLINGETVSGTAAALRTTGAVDRDRRQATVRKVEG
jgi:hypothetical protein